MFTDTFLIALPFSLLVSCGSYGHHDTTNARLAASLLPRIDAWPGAFVKAFHPGLGLCALAAVVALVGCGGKTPNTAALVFVTLAAVTGMMLHERAYIRAAQLPPLS